jgi:hypothetical protein
MGSCTSRDILGGKVQPEEEKKAAVAQREATFLWAKKRKKKISM